MKVLSLLHPVGMAMLLVPTGPDAVAIGIAAVAAALVVADAWLRHVPGMWLAALAATVAAVGATGGSAAYATHQVAWAVAGSVLVIVAIRPRSTEAPPMAPGAVAMLLSVVAAAAAVAWVPVLAGEGSNVALWDTMTPAGAAVRSTALVVAAFAATLVVPLVPLLVRERTRREARDAS